MVLLLLSLRGLLITSIIVTSFAVSSVAAQTLPGSTTARAQLGQQIDETQTTVLPGNVRADLTPQRDLGAAEDSKPMQLSLLLARTPEQQADLNALIAQQQQPGSPVYHQWLTPAQFGERFGAAQADVAKLTSWLESHGFAVQGLLNNGLMLRFTATAGQVRSAFKTEIHYWNVQGGRYAANAQDPVIPTAISSVVIGIEGLSQIPKVAHHTVVGQAAYDAQTHTWSKVEPASNGTPTPKFNAGGGNYFVTPQDYYTIYDVNKVFTGGNLGANATVAVVEQSDIQYGTVNGSGVATGGDVVTFRTLFGVSGTLNMKVMHGAGTVTCSDPGIVSGDEGEATLDAEWANALAPSAQLIFMSCDNVVDDGVITSLTALIDNNIGNVLSMSYGETELAATSSDFTQDDTLFMQAATQGQSVIMSAGDSGSDSADQNTSGAATSGLNVDYFVASPLVTGAGGTDFSDYYDAAEGGVPQSTYWSATNSSHYGDALSYIPETPWNDSCASSIIARFEGYTGAGFCGLGTSTGFVDGDVVAGGGGFSTHYAQPSFQTGTLGMSGTKRAIPDISMFAANGVWGHALVFCDSSSASSNCSSTSTFGLAGGTSFVAPALAGVTGLLINATGEAQGTLNPALYALARAQYSGSLASSCYANGQTSNTGVTTSLPAAACIFHDVTTSNNDVPCAKGSLSCYVNSGTSYGMLSTTGSSSLTVGYQTGAGYDESSGLGSIDVYNLITKWNQAYTSSTSLVAASPTVTSTTTDKLTATVTGGLPTGFGSGAPTLQGTVNFAAGSTALGSCTLSANTCSLTITGSQLASGANSITATYAGSGTYPASTSSPVTVTESGGTAPASPMVSPGTGTYLAGQQVTMTESTPGALIYYLINGGTATKYTGPITVNATEKIQAIAVLVSGSSYTTSALVTNTYTILAPPAVPTISPAAGNYTSVQTVSMSDTTTGSTIYYSLNGGAYVKYTGTFTFSTSVTISAYATVTSGGVTATSTTVTQAYKDVVPPANPTFSPTPGTFATPPAVTINESTTGALIYYSVNGGAWTQFTTSISIPAHTTTTIQAVGYLTDGPNYATSTVVKGIYVVQ